MRYEHLVNELRNAKGLNYKEYKELAGIVDNSEDRNMQVSFQIICELAFSSPFKKLNFKGMNADAILEELDKENLIWIIGMEEL